MQDAADRFGVLGTVPKTDDRDAHALLRAVYQDTRLPIEVRLDAAKIAIRFEKPRLRAAPAPMRDPLAGMTMAELQALHRLATAASSPT